MDWRTLNSMAHHLREEEEREQLHQRDLGFVHNWEFCSDGDCTSARHYHCEGCGGMESFDDDGNLI